MTCATHCGCTGGSRCMKRSEKEKGDRQMTIHVKFGIGASWIVVIMH